MRRCQLNRLLSPSSLLTIGPMIWTPWQFFLVAIAGWMNPVTSGSSTRRANSTSGNVGPEVATRGSVAARTRSNVRQGGRGTLIGRHQVLCRHEPGAFQACVKDFSAARLSSTGSRNAAIWSITSARLAGMSSDEL